jgi:hypothetical protein
MLIISWYLPLSVLDRHSGVIPGRLAIRAPEIEARRLALVWDRDRLVTITMTLKWGMIEAVPLHGSQPWLEMGGKIRRHVFRVITLLSS